MMLTEGVEMIIQPRAGKGFIASQIFSGVAALVLGLSTTAHARIHIARSLEWMTVDAPLIVRGVVTEVHTTNGLFAEQPLWNVQEVTITIHETLKGSPQQTVTFRWLNSSYESAEQWKADGHERLFFLTHGAPDYYGVNLTQDWVLYGGYPYVPVDLVTVEKAPVAADMTVAKTADQILGNVKARLEQAANAKLPMVSRPDVSVGFAHYAPNGAVQLEVPQNSEAFTALWNGSSCFLIVPADERYRLEALQMIRSNDDGKRIEGAQILSAYPGDDTVNILKGLLSDPGTHEETQYSSGKERKYEKYGVREAAWQALKRLGIDVPQPVLEK
ncbi:MAG: hypothetical protein HYZ92_01285 [Candidatus Omnitrophica bacterium]|nr:hypothetical protein [Candidatus Omnitrophota bacterium]